MTYTAPIFEGGLGGDGATFTPIQPAAPGVTAPAEQAAPVVVTPTPAITPTPATTVTIAPAAPAPVPTPRRAPTALPAPVVAGVARYSAADYAGAARALMPRGRVWPTDPDGQQAKLLKGLGRTLERVDAAAMALLSGTLPGQVSDMLPEWEAALGLPDPCAGLNPTIAQRCGQVRARFAGVGSQNRAFYIGYAASLGFDIEITNYAPMRAGRSRAGQRCAGPDWAFVWTVRVLNDASATDAALFRTGRGRAGDRLSSGAYSTDVLRCEFDRLKAAETIVLFPAS